MTANFQQTRLPALNISILPLHLHICISFFSMRVINVWNDLPTDVVNFKTLESFKRTIQLVAFSNHLTSSSNQ